MNRGTKVLTLIVVILATALFARAMQVAITNGGTLTPPSHSETKPVNQNAHVWLAAEAAVRQQLKSPSTADFGSVLGEYQDPDRQVVALDNGSYAVHGWVDAENSFGAKLRSTWVCNIKLVGDEGWSCSSIQIDK
jgi:hypothetical protein